MAGQKKISGDMKTPTVRWSFSQLHTEVGQNTSSFVPLTIASISSAISSDDSFM